MWKHLLNTFWRNSFSSILRIRYYKVTQHIKVRFKASCILTVVLEGIYSPGCEETLRLYFNCYNSPEPWYTKCLHSCPEKFEICEIQAIFCFASMRVLVQYCLKIIMKMPLNHLNDVFSVNKAIQMECSFRCWTKNVLYSNLRLRCIIYVKTWLIYLFQDIERFRRLHERTFWWFAQPCRPQRGNQPFTISLVKHVGSMFIFTTIPFSRYRVKTMHG